MNCYCFTASVAANMNDNRCINMSNSAATSGIAPFSTFILFPVCEMWYCSQKYQDLSTKNQALHRMNIRQLVDEAGKNWEIKHEHVGKPCFGDDFHY